MKLFIVIILICILQSEITSELDLQQPVGQLKWSLPHPHFYKGYIYTDSRIVQVEPPLQIILEKGEEVCQFQISKSVDSASQILKSRNINAELFHATVHSAHLGIGRIELKKEVDLSKLTNPNVDQFILVIKAISCQNEAHESSLAQILIKVLHPPKPIWEKPFYRMTIDTDVPAFTVLGKVTAVMPRLSIGQPENSDICQYRIDQPIVSPFSIDINGIITAKVDIALSKDPQIQTLLLSASDCHKPVPRTAEVNLFITLGVKCNSGWTGFHGQLNYSQDTSTIEPIGRNIKFQFCGDDSKSGEPSSESAKNKLIRSILKDCSKREHLRIMVSVDLDIQGNKAEVSSSNNKQHQSCSLDAHSIRLQQNICDINTNESMELLKNLFIKNIGIVEFPTDSNIFPLASIPTPSQMTIYFWVKRESIRSRSPLQTVLSEVTDTGREIFKIEIANCKIYLVVLEQKESIANEITTPIFYEYFSKKLCNNKWHFVFVLLQRTGFQDDQDVNSRDTKVQLYLDGEILTISKPPYKTNSVISKSRGVPIQSDIFIGQSPNSKNQTDFEGLLAGIVVHPDQLLVPLFQSPDSRGSGHSGLVRCLQHCTERLHFSALSDMKPRMSVSLNSAVTTVIINGHSTHEIAVLLDQIGYVHPGYFSTNKKARSIVVRTEIRCGNHQIPLDENKINISITNHHSHKSSSLPIGLTLKLSTETIYLNSQSKQAIFSNLSISAHLLPINSGDETTQILVILTKCAITVTPPLMTNQERWDWPVDTVAAVRSRHQFVDVTNTSDSITLQGPHNHHVYLFIIQNIRVISSTPSISSVKHRKFSVQCQSIRKRDQIVNSNVLSVEVVTGTNKPIISNDAISTRNKRLNREVLHKNLVKPMHSFSNDEVISLNLVDHKKMQPTVSTGAMVAMILLILVSMFLLALVTRSWQLRRNRNKTRNHQPLPHKSSQSLSSTSSSSVSHAVPTSSLNPYSVLIKSFHNYLPINSQDKSPCNQSQFKKLFRRHPHNNVHVEVKKKNKSPWKHSYYGNPKESIERIGRYGNHRNVSLEMEWDTENPPMKSIVNQNNKVNVTANPMFSEENKVSTLPKQRINTADSKQATNNIQKYPYNQISLDDEPPPVTDADESYFFDLDLDRNKEGFEDLIYTDDDEVYDADDGVLYNNKFNSFY